MFRKSLNSSKLGTDHLDNNVSYSFEIFRHNVCCFGAKNFVIQYAPKIEHCRNQHSARTEVPLQQDALSSRGGRESRSLSIN